MSNVHPERAAIITWLRSPAAALTIATVNNMPLDARNIAEALASTLEARDKNSFPRMLISERECALVNAARRMSTALAAEDTRTAARAREAVWFYLDEAIKAYDEEPTSPRCVCVCRSCAEGDHCAGGKQEGLGDCMHPEPERDPEELEPKLPFERIRVLSSRAGGHFVGAPATRDEEQNMANEILRLRAERKERRACATASAKSTSTSVPAATRPDVAAMVDAVKRAPVREPTSDPVYTPASIPLASTTTDVASATPMETDDEDEERMMIGAALDTWRMTRFPSRDKREERDTEDGFIAGWRAGNRRTKKRAVADRRLARFEAFTEAVEIAERLGGGTSEIAKAIARYIEELRACARPKAAPKPPAPSFKEAWKQKEREGYQYGRDALEQVRFGWEIREQYAVPEPETLLVAGHRFVEQLEKKKLVNGVVRSYYRCTSCTKSIAINKERASKHKPTIMHPVEPCTGPQTVELLSPNDALHDAARKLLAMIDTNTRTTVPATIMRAADKLRAALDACKVDGMLYDLTIDPEYAAKGYAFKIRVQLHRHFAEYFMPAIQSPGSKAALTFTPVEARPR